MLNEKRVTNIVLDASALLALIRKEKGAEVVESYIPRFTMSSVNIAEVAAVLVRDGTSAAEAEQGVRAIVGRIVPFDDIHAFASAALFPATQPFGLSLGDRACLALGQTLRLPVLTAEQIWRKLSLPVEMRWIR